MTRQRCRKAGTYDRWMAARRRGHLRRDRPRGGWFVGPALILVGLAMLFAWVTWIDHYEQTSEELRSNGGSTPGTVVALRPDIKGSSGAAQVAYTVNGHDYVRPVDLGSFVNNYDEGQAVTVHYDRAHPERMTINDETNQPSDLVLPMALLGVGGVGVVIFGVVAIRRHVVAGRR